jgi:MHS family proline/betaine transporter-like MFS transporter
MHGEHQGEVPLNTGEPHERRTELRKRTVDRLHLRKKKKRLTEDDITVVDNDSVNTAVKAAALGNAMEWYDFGVYSYLAVTIGKVFFPSGNDTAQLLSSLATFAAAFLIRPIGGMFFGPLGDRIGRKKVLMITMVMMATATLAIGLIPSYATIGFAAPVLLILFRMLQGFSTGGEYGGASTFIAEYAPDKRRGFFGSFLEFGTLIGYTMAAGLVTILNTTLSDDSMISWGWRIPFLVAGPMGVIGLYLRLKLEESPAYSAMADAQEKSGVEAEKQELKSIFIDHWQALLLCVALVAAFNVTDYMLLSYMPTYLSDTLGYSDTHGLLMIIVVMLVLMVIVTPVGRMSDRFGRRPLLAGACIGFVVLSIPALLLIKQGSMIAIFAGLMILGLCLVPFLSVMAATLPALFPTKVRSGAMSIGFNISVSLFGGTTPLVVAALISATGNDMMPAFYMMLFGIVGLIAVVKIKETARKPLMGSGPSVETQEEAQALVKAQDEAPLEFTFETPGDREKSGV